MKRAISFFVTLILPLGMYTQTACKMSAHTQHDQCIPENSERTEQPETRMPEPTTESALAPLLSAQSISR